MSLRDKFRTVGSILVTVAIVGLVVGSLTGIPVGIAFVETGSMEPTLEPGDGFVPVPAPLVGDVDRGDVVTFRSAVDSDQLTTHRVVEETDNGFITAGDANAFTDQQAGDRVVSRDRIVAVALQLNGRVVVVPNVESVVDGLQSVILGVGGLVGFEADPGRIAAALLAAMGAVLILDELFATRGERNRPERPGNRDDGFHSRHLLVGGIGLVVLVATLSMVLASGTATFAYDSVQPGEASQGGVVAGTTTQTQIRVSNSGFVPAVAFLEVPGESNAMRNGPVVIGPRANETVNVTVSAPVAPGRYEQTVVQHRYLGVLPTSVVRTFHEIHPWVAIAVVDGLLAIALGVIGRLLLGRGRVRFHGRNGVPADVSGRRIFRRLYR